MGLGIFLTVAKAMKRNKTKLILFAPQPQAAEVFASAGISQIIPIVADETAALSLATA